MPDNAPSPKPAQSVSDKPKRKFPIFLVIGGIVGAVALIPLSCFFCCGFMGILGFQRQQETRKTLEEANQLWAAGRKADAVAKYKPLIDEAIDAVPSSDKPTVYQRVIEFEIEQGNTSYAKRMIEKAVDRDVSLSFTSPTARQLLAEAQREREDRRLAEAKRREAENREGKQSGFAWDTPPKADPKTEPKKSGDGSSRDAGTKTDAEKEYVSENDFDSCTRAIVADLGTNPNQTKAALKRWQKDFNLSSVQVGQLGRDIRDSGRSAGLTGDRVFPPLEEARQDMMQQGNTYTGTAAATRIRLRFFASR
jgi:hypothetical protein